MFQIQVETDNRSNPAWGMCLYGWIYMVANASAIIVVQLYVHAIGLWYDPRRGVTEMAGAKQLIEERQSPTSWSSNVKLQLEDKMVH